MSDKHPATPQYAHHPRSDQTKNQLSDTNPLGVPPANLLSPHFSDYVSATEGGDADITNRRPHHLREDHKPHYHSEEQDVPVTVPGKGVFSSSSEAALALGIAKSGISVPSTDTTPLHDPLITKESEKRGEKGTYIHSEKYAAPPSSSSSITHQSLTEENRNEGTNKYGGPSGASMMGGTGGGGGGSGVAGGQTNKTQQSSIASHHQTDGGIGIKKDEKKTETIAIINTDIKSMNNSVLNRDETFSVLFPELFDANAYMESIKKDAPRHNGLLHLQQFIEKAKKNSIRDPLRQWIEGENGDRLKAFIANETLMAFDGVFVQEPVLLGAFIQLIRIQKIADLMKESIEKEGNKEGIAKGAEILQAELLQLNLLCITPLIRLITEWEDRGKAHNLMMEHIKQTVNLLNKILQNK